MAGATGLDARGECRNGKANVKLATTGPGIEFLAGEPYTCILERGRGGNQPLPSASNLKRAGRESVAL